MTSGRLLVVEDQSIIALDLSARLTALGYQVAGVAATGEDAIQQALHLQPDLVLMDIRLRGELDGIQAAEKIRATLDVPVIYLTAHSDANTLRRARLTEPYGYILKPFEDRELHMAIDIALYKHQAEARLRENDRWLATTLRSIGDAVIATDGNGLVKFMNPVAEALTGWTQAEALGQALPVIFQIINEETRAEAHSPVSRVLQEGQVVGLANHTILVARDGIERPIEDSAAPIRNERGDIQGVVLVFHDITQRKQTEAAAREGERQFKAVVANLPGYIYRVANDAARTPFLISAGVVHVTGYAQQEYLVERTITCGAEIHPDDQARIRELVQQAIAACGPYECEYRIITKSGAVKWAWERGRGAYGDDGQLLFLEGFVTDITQRKQAEELLRVRNAELAGLLAQAKALTAAAEQANRLKDEILANTSHELRSPLTAILGSLDLILSQAASSEAEMRTFVHAAREAAERLLELVNALLDLAKLEAGKMHVEREPMDVALLLAEVATLVQGRLKQKGLTLRVHWLTEPPAAFESDPGHLRRILLNLLDNSIKFTPQGEITIQAEVLGRSPDQPAGNAGLRIHVQDTGVGIPCEMQERLFQPFVQGDGSITRRFGGTGLGLSISRRLTELLGGSLSLFSAGAEMGTRVTLCLPVVHEADV